jgi:predicted secreted protein
MTIRKILVLGCCFHFLIQFFALDIVYPKEVVSVVLTKEDSGTVVDIGAGDFLEIELEGNPSTGFWWHFDNLDEKYLELVKEETKKISEIRLGAPVLGRWTLKAKNPGEAAIKMAYYRQWEGADKAVDRVSFVVKIK